MQNLNQYNPENFKKIFSQTDIYAKLINDFDFVTFDNTFNHHASRGTPREWYGNNKKKTIFSAVPFYYLEFLTRHNPSKIYDVGCGWNIFKKYIPNIIGIAGEPAGSPHFYGDEYGFVDVNYIKNHQEYFESMFSINSLHFFPLRYLRKTMLDILSMIKPDGRLFLALNFARMHEVDDTMRHMEINEIEHWMRTEVFENLPVEYEVFEINLDTYDQYMDGNIRMVMHKNDSR